MRPALPVHLRLIHQLEVNLIDQIGGLQGVAVSLHPHVTLGDAPQFAINQRDQPIETVPVPGPPAEEQFRHRLGFGGLQNFIFPPLCLSRNYSAYI
jgi:hypothetical protein